jgi:hypothetical protein
MLDKTKISKAKQLYVLHGFNPSDCARYMHVSRPTIYAWLEAAKLTFKDQQEHYFHYVRRYLQKGGE